ASKAVPARKASPSRRASSASRTASPRAAKAASPSRGAAKKATASRAASGSPARRPAAPAPKPAKSTGRITKTAAAATRPAKRAAEMEPGDIQFDEESGEGATMNVERERDLALSAQNRAAVDEIDRALAKIDNGSYGLCEQCGQPIPKPRLKALPYASLCVA